VAADAITAMGANRREKERNFLHAEVKHRPAWEKEEGRDKVVLLSSLFPPRNPQIPQKKRLRFQGRQRQQAKSRIGWPSQNGGNRPLCLTHLEFHLEVFPAESAQA